MTGLAVRGARVTFGAKVAVDDVDLDLEPGQVLAVLGPSGCGKSTLLRAVAGLEPLAAGRISWEGRDLAGVPAHRRGFALMFQDGQLFAHRDVAGNVGYALGLRGIKGAARTARVAELLDLVGLHGYDARDVTTLSGGEQQRVALARSLAADPALLLLDEPLSALDRGLRERLAVDLRAILHAAGTTAMLVTHDPDEAFTVADRMAVMLRGRVVQSGPSREVWTHPVDREVGDFLGFSVVLNGAYAARLAHEAGLQLASDAALAVRRSALWVDPRGTLDGTVLESVAMTDSARLLVRVPELGDLPALADVGTTLAPGDPVRLMVTRDGLAPLTA